MKKRVAIISAGLLPLPAVSGGAVEVLSELLINGLSKDYIVDVFSISDKRLKSYKKNNVNIHEIKVYKCEILFCRVINKISKILGGDLAIFPYDLKVSNKIKNNKYDLIIVENSCYLYNNVYKNYSFKTKFILHLHNEFDSVTKRGINAYKFVSKTASKILVVSNYLKKKCLKVQKTNNIDVFYNCVDLELFNQKNIQNSNEKVKNKFSYIYTGRICDEKGVLELIKAFTKMNDKYQNIELTIVGAGWFSKKKKSSFEIKLQNISAKVKEKIIFTGYLNHDDIPVALSKADCVIIPSKWEEAFGVVALEAMAMKKAIIATNSGGLVEPLNKECAIIIERENLVENLYNSMEKLYKDEKLRERLANNAYERVHSIKDFNKEYYFDNFLKLSGIEEENSNENK